MRDVFIRDVPGGEVFLAIHPEETEIRAWIRIYPGLDNPDWPNTAVVCGESFYGYAGKRKYIELTPLARVLV